MGALRAPAISLLLLLALPAVAAAEDAPPLPAEGSAPETRMFQYSAYEEATISAALAELGFTRDAHPEGKTVESIDTVRLEVIEERDPAPRLLNVFHVVSRREVIEREVLLERGGIYRQALADETRRKLATLPQLSLVLVVAAEGSAPDRTRGLVITKDVWSLRLNWNLALSRGGIEALSINPSETNFLGTHQTAGLLFNWLPRSYALGAQYAWPRVLGSHVTAFADAGLTYDSTTGRREGSFGDLVVSLPLWSSRTEWSWGAAGSWLTEVTRRYSQGQLASFTDDPRITCAGPSPPGCLPDAYLTDISDVNAFVTRSFGWAVKHDLTVGFDARRSRYGLPDPSGFTPALVEAYQQARVPVGEDRVGPFLQYRTYSSDFVRVIDLETLALQEDHRLGPEAYLRLYPVLRSLGSSHDLIGVSAGISGTVAIGDGLARAGLESITEVRTHGDGVSDGSILATLRLASPRWKQGRLVVDGVLLDRYANGLNHLTYLGGDTRLRGFPSQYLVGTSALAVNAEYRARPWQILSSLQLGGVLFYDAGDAFDGWDRLHLWQAAGLGARVLFPQLDRVVFRIDVGFPLARPLPAAVPPVSFFVTFGQAFSLYEIVPRTAFTR